LFRFTATIGHASAGGVVGIVTIATASVVSAANGVARAAVPTPVLGPARFGFATIDSKGAVPPSEP